jgi:dihydroneopterin aldolase
MELTFVVKLEAMRFHTRIGALPHEAEIAQSLEVDLSAFVSRDGSARGGEGIVDYRSLYDVVAGIIGGGHILYLEDLVAEIADQALRIPGVSRVVVSARKPQVALQGPLSHAQVTLDRARND